MTAPTQPTQRPAFQLTPAVQWIAVVWLGVALLQATVVTHADVLAWLGLNATNHGHAWWTLVSYNVVHGTSAQLLLDLFVLLTFGPQVESVMGTRSFLLFILWCVLGGALTALVFAPSGILESGAAALFGVMLAYVLCSPKDEVTIFGVVPVKATILIVILSGAVTGVGSSTTVISEYGFLTQCGGFLFAILYFRRPRRAAFEDLKQHMSPAPDPTDDAPHAIPRSIPHTRHAEDPDEIVARSEAATMGRLSSSTQPTERQQGRRTALDRVLDKISEQGLDALSAEDRTLLEEISRKLRDH